MTKVSCFFVITFLVLSSSLFAQKINLGADLVNRYVWRGLDIAKTPSLQPTIEYNNSGFVLGAWGAYTLSNSESSSDEIDFYFGYSLDSEIGNLGFLVVDYYFPNSGAELGNFKNGKGGNTFEGIITFERSNSFPISLLVGVNFYNDIGHNSYFELGYFTSLKKVNLSIFVGATPGSKENPDFYGAESFKIINAGLKVSKEIKISNDFSLPVFLDANNKS